MVSWATSIFLSNQFIPISAVVTAAAVPCSSCSTNFLKVCSPRSRMYGLSFAESLSRVRAYAVNSNQASSMQIRPGTWEDPDNGSGSEYDEDDEGEENDWGHEVNSNQASSMQIRPGTWEDPDNGSGSEYDEDDEGEENDWGHESDWEEEIDASATTNVDKSTINTYEEDLVKEVEQLLGPEERAILQQNVKPNLGKISTAKWSPLHTLALSGQIPFMDKLLENGLDIDSVDQDGLTALHKAIIGKKEAVISHLLRKGADPHVKDRDGATPLHYAVQVGAIQTVKLLIKYKVDVNVADNEGWTPLHVAIQSRNRFIAKVLLVNGADKNRRTKDGRTPMDLNFCYGKDFKSFDLAKLLKIMPANRDF